MKLSANIFLKTSLGLFLYILLSPSGYTEFLRDAAKGKDTFVTVVVHGKKAPSKEMEMARTIGRKLRQFGAEEEYVKTDEYVQRFRFYFASSTLIAVGTYDSNRLCRGAAQNRVFDRFSMSTDIAAFKSLQDKSAVPVDKYGFATADYGYYRKIDKIGLVLYEVNPLYIQAENMTFNQGNFPTADMIMITGIDTAGVVAAGRAFLKGMLEGIVFEEKQGLPGKSGRFRFGTENLAELLPKQLNPQKIILKEGKKTLAYKGWMMGGLNDFAGLKNLTGIDPFKVYHLKFREETDTFPKRIIPRSKSRNTLVLVDFADSAKSLAAFDKVKKFFSLHQGEITGSPFNAAVLKRKGKKCLVVQKQSYLIFANFDELWQKELSAKLPLLFLN